MSFRLLCSPLRVVVDNQPHMIRSACVNRGEGTQPRSRPPARGMPRRSMRPKAGRGSPWQQRGSHELAVLCLGCLLSTGREGQVCSGEHRPEGTPQKHRPKDGSTPVSTSGKAAMP